MILALLALACLTPSADSLDTADSFGGQREALVMPARAPMHIGIDLDGDRFVMSQDCNDRNAAINPDAREICDGIDNDCDGLIDVADPNYLGSTRLAYRDLDGDGWGDPRVSRPYCLAPPADWVSDNRDCDDGDPGVPVLVASDNDGDGCGDNSPAADVFPACYPVPGYAPNRDDRDDSDPAVCL